MTRDEQMAREWLLPLLQDMVAKVLSDHTVLKEQQQIIEQVDALLASRALEEAKWWATYSGAICKGKETCVGCARIAALEQAAASKGGQ